MVANKDIDWMLSQDEGQYIEFKQGISNTVGEAICAFANSSGGSIIIGSRPRGGFADISDPSEAAARLENMARTCDPSVQINVTHFTREGHKLLMVNVPESENKPHSFGSVFYMRVGHRSQRMKRDELVEFFHATGQVRYEDIICTKFNYPEEFDTAAFQKFLRTSGITQPESNEDMLLNLGVAEQRGNTLLFNNTGVLFFSKEPRRLLPHITVDCVLFAGNDRVDILDRKEMTGNLMDNVEQAMIFLKRHISLRYEITELKRKEKYEIPEPALREAILNAVIHRDYHIEEAWITVCIFRDRVEISSPGGLPPGLKPEDFGHKSMHRNRRIAEMFHRLGEVERVGTGIERMRKYVQEEGLKEPQFTFTTFFTLTFEKHEAHDEAHDGAHDGAHDETENVVSELALRILDLCKTPMSTPEMINELGHAKRSGALTRTLKQLLDEDLIDYTIPDKPRSKKQKYLITKKGRKLLKKL